MSTEKGTAILCLVLNMIVIPGIGSFLGNKKKNWIITDRNFHYFISSDVFLYRTYSFSNCVDLGSYNGNSNS